MDRTYSSCLWGLGGRLKGGLRAGHGGGLGGGLGEDLKGDMEEDLEEDLEGDLEGNLKGNWRGGHGGEHGDLIVDGDLEGDLERDSEGDLEGGLGEGHGEGHGGGHGEGRGGGHGGLHGGGHRVDHSETFLVFRFVCGTPPSCSKVMGWVGGGGGLKHFSVSPRPLGFWFRAKGLGPGLDKKGRFKEYPANTIMVTSNRYHSHYLLTFPLTSNICVDRYTSNSLETAFFYSIISKYLTSAHGTFAGFAKMAAL